MKFFRRNGSNQGAVPKGEINFERACREIEDLVAHREIDDLVKSKRRASSVRELSDAKDFDDQNLDDFDRRPSARRRRDMDATYPGLQAMDEMLSDADDADPDEDLSHEMLVSGRPSRVKFPGARGDSRLEPVSYVHDADDGEDDDGISGQRAIRARYGGDRISRRAQRRGPREDYLEDEDVVGKSLGFRNRPVKLSYDLLKSKLQDAMCAGDVDPAVVLNFASVEPKIGSDGREAMQALARIPVAVRRAYRLPTDLGEFESYGEVAREYAA